MKIPDWANERKNAGDCVIPGFHSQIEKDVFDILLKGTQPIILVPARGLMKKIPADLLREVEKKRLLIVSPFEERNNRVTQENANMRNKIMIEMADEIFVAYKTEGGNLDKMLFEIQNKEIKSLSW
ncbi:MAG: DNA-binding protein [Prolixibacteraceae bacterium]|nr:DNA-binding protein [Prolixibacteraceae bacterium]